MFPATQTKPGGLCYGIDFAVLKSKAQKQSQLNIARKRRGVRFTKARSALPPAEAGEQVVPLTPDRQSERLLPQEPS